MMAARLYRFPIGTVVAVLRWLVKTLLVCCAANKHAAIERRRWLVQSFQDLPPTGVYPAQVRGLAYPKSGLGQQVAVEF